MISITLTKHEIVIYWIGVLRRIFDLYDQHCDGRKADRACGTATKHDMSLV